MPSDIIMNDFKKEMTYFAIEYLEGRIKPQRLELLDKLLAENPEARAIYRNMIRLQAGLKHLYGKKADTTVPVQTESAEKKIASE